MSVRFSDLAAFEAQAAEVAAILRELGNERRLMILCKLVEWGTSPHWRRPLD